MKILKTILSVLGFIIVALVACFLLLLGFLTIREYKPKDIEPSELLGEKNPPSPHEGDTLNFLSWNLGYCDLSDNADFFMSHGKNVRSCTKERAGENLSSIISFLKESGADILMLQEVDVDSSRSYYVNQADVIGESFPNKVRSFAYNFNVDFIPYPIPPIGRVKSGLASYVPYKVSEAYRKALPVPFKWPVRMANLKRCLLVNRIPLADSQKELVIINLHLEAFDNGEGKIAQTRELLSVMEAEYEKGNYVVCAGDWNQVFSNTDTSAYPERPGTWQPGAIDLADFSEHWQFRQDNTHPTCRSTDKVYAGSDKSTFQYYMLDGFVVSDNITIHYVNTVDLDFVSTDHNPVVMSATLN